MKTCTKCKIKKDISEFATVRKNDVEYVRNQCTSCRAKQDYQVRLNKLLKKGYPNIIKCFDCDNLVKSIVIKRCNDCRIKMNA